PRKGLRRSSCHPERSEGSNASTGSLVDLPGLSPSAQDDRRRPPDVDRLRPIGFIPGAPQRAPVAELVDAPDSKSGFLTEVLVRVRPGAPSLKSNQASALANVLGNPQT